MVELGVRLAAAGLTTVEPRAGDFTRRWALLTPGANGETVVATVGFDGATLSGETNSAARGDRLVELIAQALPQAAVTNRRRSKLDDVRQIRASAGVAEPASDPELAGVLREVVSAQERRWVDEQIPALKGRTPREAMADPIGVEELQHLLDGFPDDPDSFSAMSATRIRRILGLSADH